MWSPQSSFGGKVLVVSEFAHLSSAHNGTEQVQRSPVLCPAHRPPAFSRALNAP